MMPSIRFISAVQMFASSFLVFSVDARDLARFSGRVHQNRVFHMPRSEQWAESIYIQSVNVFVQYSVTTSRRNRNREKRVSIRQRKNHHPGLGVQIPWNCVRHLINVHCRHVARSHGCVCVFGWCTYIPYIYICKNKICSQLDWWLKWNLTVRAKCQTIDCTRSVLL